ncbi:MAG TPA: hypothetical protein PLP82_06075 [Deltaproteobacteria bacterium]|nr:MAG: hypothetical protein BWX71_02781 [Deltaproteobacteria bacterium ADurb.Bin072]HOC76948.1 hypothetical protein [Deltaproteobacteria bacterium]HON95857.1 hypothetical protein [Deltaproteobacteria bacterium]HPA76850.1 hypothetical protein [Deltaproteobacteria bacterium]HPH51727.1 hypothetical protein [Deltaproteobacteria bacterium]
MAEKELRSELDDLVRELTEIREELKPRLSELMRVGKPVALVLAGLLGVKIGLKITRGVLRLLWGNRFIVAAVLVFSLVMYNQAKARRTGGDSIGGGSGTG